MRSFYTTIVSTLATLVTLTAHASAEQTWPADESELRLETRAYTSAARTQYTHTGDRLPLLDPASPGSVHRVGMMLAFEIGLFPRFSLLTHTTFQNVRFETEETHAAVAGLADWTVGGRWAFYEGAFTLSAAPAVKFPTGYTPDAGPFVPSLGNGVNEYEVRLWGGKRYTEMNLFAELGAGYRFRGPRVPRGGGPPLIYADEIVYDAAFGIDPIQNVPITASIGGVYGLGEADAISRVTLRPRMEKRAHVGFGAGYRPFPSLRILARYQFTAAGVNALNEQIFSIDARFDYEVNG